jgi:menaquinone-dependent protoporphyrinogen oxidase
MTAPRILVAYAGEHGSTREIAECLARRLVQRGAAADCVPVGPTAHPAAYQAVVLGSAIHDGAWLPEAATFAHLHAAALAARTVWLFSVGMPGALGPLLRRAAARAEAGAVLKEFREEIRPRGERLFTGVVRQEHLPRRGGLVLRLLGGRFGDFRDWPAIRGWADDIATALGCPHEARDARTATPSA